MTGWSIGLCDAIGFIASALTLVTFAQRSMIPMRVSALGANAFFIGYGALGPYPPVLALHIVLLPLNARRLIEHWRHEHPARENIRLSFNSGRHLGGALLFFALCLVPHSTNAASTGPENRQPEQIIPQTGDARSAHRR